MKREKMRKYILPTLTLLGVIVVTFLIFKACGDIAPEQPITPDKTDSLKKVITNQEKVKDSLLILANRKDSVRVEYITKWKKLKGDTAFLPCDTILNLVISTCDSIIAIDSALIGDLKGVIKVDSGIIANYKKVVVNDSTTIVGLNREINKQKGQKKLIGGIGAVGWLIAIFK